MRQLDDDIWVHDDATQHKGVNLGMRSTILRRSDGGLVIISPTPFDDATAAAIDDLGLVRVIAAPNLFHHMYLAPAAARWPGATVIGPRGLQKKREDVSFTAFYGDEAPDTWGDTIVVKHLRGAKALREATFFHAPSNTLVCTDLVFNLAHTASLMMRIYLRLSGALGKPGTSILLRLVTRDKPSARESLSDILSQDFQRLIMAHGDVIEEGGNAALRDAWSWLLGPRQLT